MGIWQWAMLGALVLLFIYTRAFFLAKYILPEIDPDTMGYFYYGKLLFEGNLTELSQIPIDFPPAYPLFIAGINAVFHSARALITAQMVVSLIGFVVLLWELLQWGQVVSYVGGTGLLLFALDSRTIRYESAFMTESLFLVSLMLLCAAFLRAIRRGTIQDWCWLSVMFWLPSFVRPNGLYVYLMLAILAILLFKDRKMPQLKALVMPFVLLQFAWMGFNYIVSGVPYPGNTKRLVVALSVRQEALGLKAPSNSERHLEDSTFRQIVWYTKATYKPSSHFYSNELPIRFERFYKSTPPLPLNTEYNGLSFGTPADPDVSKIAYGEFMDLGFYKNPDKTIKELRSLAGWGNLPFIPFNLIYKITSLVRQTRIFTVLFLVLLLVGIIRFLKHPALQHPNTIMLFIVLFFVVNMMLIAVAHGRCLIRYLHPCMVFLYLLPAFAILSFKKNPANAKQ